MKKYQKKNIVLIGMPGAGKSTLGIILAKMCSKNYVDTDVLIQLEEKRTLQEILDTDGYLTLREVEAKILLKTTYTNFVIATGGSAVYSEDAINHLKKNGLVVYLKVNFKELKKRISNFGSRGIALKPGQNFEELFREREKLYEKYADFSISCKGKSIEALATLIEKRCS